MTTTLVVAEVVEATMIPIMEDQGEDLPEVEAGITRQEVETQTIIRVVEEVAHLLGIKETVVSSCL